MVFVIIFLQAIHATIEQKGVMVVPAWEEHVVAYHVKNGFARVNGISNWPFSRRDRLRSK
jgi:N-acetylglutamate synthase-like GNAT family acetyltransferase